MHVDDTKKVEYIECLLKGFTDNYGRIIKLTTKHDFDNEYVKVSFTIKNPKVKQCKTKELGISSE